MAYLGGILGAVVYDLLVDKQTETLNLVYQFNLLRFLFLMVASTCVPSSVGFLVASVVLSIIWVVRVDWPKWTISIIILAFSIFTYSFLVYSGPHWGGIAK